MGWVILRFGLLQVFHVGGGFPTLGLEFVIVQSDVLKSGFGDCKIGGLIEVCECMY